MTIGERIKKLRKELNLTQLDFCTHIGLQRNSISLVESGKRNISNQAILSICREFNVREEWLREGVGEMFADEDETLIAQIAAEYHLDEKSRAMMANFLKLSDYERAVIVQASEIMAKKFAAAQVEEQAAPPESSEATEDAAEKQQTTHMVEMTEEEYREFMSERTAREFEQEAAGSLDSAG